MHVVLFHVIYCIASGAQRLIGPRGNTYLADQRSRVLTVALCGISYLAYGHLGFWGAVILCSMDSLEVQHPTASCDHLDGRIPDAAVDGSHQAIGRQPRQPRRCAGQRGMCGCGVWGVGGGAPLARTYIICSLFRIGVEGGGSL